MLEISADPQPANPQQAAKVTPQSVPAELNTSSALRGMAGLAVLIVVAQNLGFPGTGDSVALDVLLLTVGCSTVTTVLAYSEDKKWMRPFWLDQIGRAYPCLLYTSPSPRDS